ncbi:kinase-like domain-containing protein [Pisolithus orientalis]|uniref:kinase-like domain-containing protein n=1 Tax=Pisolithus orientalis TaxID=936130 RepID=UPI0022242C03|nr:kinase-like domain-containing protein [Pisolithus orientalis]KAI5987754.1 kinase-like domain-containing protein [Pisolithus orientalis]
MDLSIVLDELCCRASGFSINLNGRVRRTSGRSALRGGTAGVHHGTLTPDGTEVAIKTFHCTHSGDADAFKRIFREVHIWSKLRHENVVRMLGISTEFDSTVSIISEWMSLGNAHNYVQSIENDPRSLLEDIASGLCYLHNYVSPPDPIVHGDLKGVNVLVSSDRRALLSDFGLSTVNISTFSMTVDALRGGGSLHWMAPELLDDYPPSKESDAWALGMTILELFTRSIPFRDCRNMGSVTRRITEGKPPTRPVGESTQFRLSDAWWEICTTCWRRDPSSRPTIEDIIEKIKAAIHQAGPTAMPPEAAASGHPTSKEPESYQIPRETLVDEVVRRDATTDQALEGSTAMETVMYDRASDTAVPGTYRPGTRRTSKKSIIKGLRFLHVRGKAPVKLGFVPQTQPGVLAPNVPGNPAASQSTTEQPIATHSTSVQDAVRSAGTRVAADIPAPANTLSPPNALAPPNRKDLRPTTDDLIQQCPRFRVLLVGKSGVGKSTLINRIFGVDCANVAKDRPGNAEIEQEFTSPENNWLILHDSRSFEAGDAGNYEVVKSFIVERKREPGIKDQLHAVWLCLQIPIPTHGEPLLEGAAEAFLEIRKEVLGNTPTIVVFTKYDRLVSFMRQRMPGDPEAGQRYLQEECVQKIEDFTRENIAHVVVSSKPRYEQGLEELISLTQDMISMSFTSPENQVSPVPLAAAGAQRMLPI